MNATKLELNFGIILGLLSFLWSNLEKALDWIPSGGVLPSSSLFGWFTVAGMVLTIQAFKKLQQTADWTWWKGTVSLTVACGLMAIVAIPLHWVFVQVASPTYWEQVIASGKALGMNPKMVEPFATFKNYSYTYLTFGIGLGFLWASMVNAVLFLRKSKLGR